MTEPVILEFEFRAGPERVFDAWTLAAEIASWWRDPDEFATEIWEGDLRPGGAWRVVFRGADGGKSSASGVYREVQRPSRLSFTWKPDWDDDPPTLIAFEIAPMRDGARLTLTHSGFSSEQAREDNAGAWDGPMAMVAAHLAKD